MRKKVEEVRRGNIMKDSACLFLTLTIEITVLSRERDHDGEENEPLTENEMREGGRDEQERYQNSEK